MARIAPQIDSIEAVKPWIAVTSTLKTAPKKMIPVPQFERCVDVVEEGIPVG